MFFHGAWTFELSSTNILDMTLFKSNDFSNQCPQLAWGPEDLVSPTRRNEIHQINPNGTKPKRVKHLGWFLFPFLVSGVVRVSHFSKPAGICWNLPLVVVASLGCEEWRVCGVPFFSAEGASSAIIIFNYLQLLWTCLITTFLPCHLLPFVHVRCVFPHKNYKDHSNAFCRLAHEVCPFGLRPWMAEM